MTPRRAALANARMMYVIAWRCFWLATFALISSAIPGEARRKRWLARRLRPYARCNR